MQSVDGIGTLRSRKLTRVYQGVCDVPKWKAEKFLKGFNNWPIGLPGRLERHSRIWEINMLYALLLRWMPFWN